MKTDIKKYNFKKELHLQIEVIVLQTLISKHRSSITIPHRTNFYHIFLFENCRPTHTVDFNPIKVKPRSMLFVNKDNVHLFDKSSTYQGKVLIFTDDFFCQTENDRAFLHSTILFNDLLSVSAIQLKARHKEFAGMFDAIENELKNEADNNQYAMLQNMVHNLLLAAERVKRRQGFLELKKGADLDYTVLFKELVNEKYDMLKSVGHYAKLLSVSEKRLNQATTKILGKTPKQMIDERVLLEAKRLLNHTHLSIKEIGFALGFEEPTNFIKYFRKHTAKTPAEFRESLPL